MWFDPDRLSSTPDPYGVYRRLRDEFPVCHFEDSRRDYWILSRYDDVSEALGDWRTFSSVDSMSHRRSETGLQPAFEGEQLITTDPPYHDGLRRVVRDRFSPKVVQSLAATIAREVTNRLSVLETHDIVDIAADFAWPVTLAVISEIIGIPEGDRSQVLSWYHAAEYLCAHDTSTQPLASFAGYFAELASERHRRPRGDLMSDLMRAVARGEISRLDALVLCKDLFEGGVDVPANLIANSVLALAEHPKQRAYLAKGDEARWRLAVEELARYESPIQSIPRKLTAAVRRHGVTIPQGAIALLFLGSANRDERRFARPDMIDVSRPATRNLAFGSGVHFCIGAPLARLVARVALPALFAALPSYEVIPPVERPVHDPVMRALLHLEVAAPVADARVAAVAG
jgi:cytochrome P450